jgi:hypothetical protein
MFLSTEVECAMRTALKSYISGGTLASGRIAQIEKINSFKPFDGCNTPFAAALCPVYRPFPG